MSDAGFFSSIKAGQYVKVKCRNDKPYVHKITKVTRTQIVISEFWYDDTLHTNRFRISDGVRVDGSYYRFDRDRIIPDPVSPEEAAAYEARIAENERMRKERKRLTEVEVWAKNRLSALFGGHIASDNIKVQFSSNDGLKTVFCEIKCEKVSEESLQAALKE